jgi:sarcosine oxidase subunit gamma
VHDLAPLTALGAATPRHDMIGGVTIAENPNVALASVAARRGKSEPCATALADWRGAPVPEVAQHSGDAKTGFWLGPDMWMLEAPFATHEDMARDLGTRFEGLASVTEQTDAWARFDLSGDGPDDMLARLTNLDLATLPNRFARRTVMEHIGCYLLRRGATYSVYGPRSFAASLHHALCLSAGAL